jgi:hypothetical protein
MDLSVLHDNAGAIALYEKLGFHRLPLFAVKRRNVINERLFVGHDPAKDMNPYARIIINEARRRGILVDVIDAGGGLFQLSSGGRVVRCRESLSELTSAVALSICDDKAMTRRIVAAAGVAVPDEVEASDPAAVKEMLARHGSLVVKPARGEQGPRGGGRSRHHRERRAGDRSRPRAFRPGAGGKLPQGRRPAADRDRLQPRRRSDPAAA